VEYCPECREPISREYSEPSALLLAVNAHACYDAKDLDQLVKPSALIVLFGTVVPLLSPDLFMWFRFFPLLLFGPIFFRIGRWYYRYGKFQFGDDAYLAAKKKMNRVLQIWVLVLGVDIGLVMFLSYSLMR